MSNVMNEVWVALGLLLIGLSLFIFMVVKTSSSYKCSKAGYEGASLELCIKRAVQGGPVYEENIPHWK